MNDEVTPAQAPPANKPFNADIVSTLLIFVLGPPLIATVLGSVLWPLIPIMDGAWPGISITAPGGRAVLPGEGLAAILLGLVGLYYSAVLFLPLLFLPVALLYALASRTVLPPSLLTALGCAALAFGGLAPFAEWSFLDVSGATFWVRLLGVVLFVALIVAGCWWLTRKAWGLPAVFLVPLGTLLLGLLMLVVGQHLLPSVLPGAGPDGF